MEDLRRNYEIGALELEQLASCPMEQFKTWFAAAQTTPSADWFEPNAMTLATANSTGQVSARIVLLKQITEHGFVFFTNYDSDKGKQLASNPHASLVFYWPHLERQVRVEGVVTKTAADTSDHYFHARPRGSQLGAVASQQSRPLPERQQLEAETERLAAAYADQEVPRPDFWGGYCLSPQRIEFWQGRKSRLHDRFVYTLDDSAWNIARLAP